MLLWEGHIQGLSERMYYSYQTRRESKAFPRPKTRAPPRQGGPEGGPEAWAEAKPYFPDSFDKSNILYNLPILKGAWGAWA